MIPGVSGAKIIEGEKQSNALWNTRYPNAFIQPLFGFWIFGSVVMTWHGRHFTFPLFLRILPADVRQVFPTDGQNFGRKCEQMISAQVWGWMNLADAWTVQYLPQIKHVFLSISSFCCFSLLRSANVSMMTPKIRFNTIIITMKKKARSYTTRATNNGSWNHEMQDHHYTTMELQRTHLYQGYQWHTSDFAIIREW
jgi:hypothetical protein